MSLDFVAFDVETANHERGSICSVGWATVRDGQIVEKGSSLCRPPEPVDWFSGFNIAIHGITEADVAAQPTFASLVPHLLDRFGDLPVIAHNAAFDIGALREALSYSKLPWPRLSYGCTLVWSRRMLDLPSHRLPIVCEHLGVPLHHHHDAGDDAAAAAEIAIALARLGEAVTLEELLDVTCCRFGRLQPGDWIGCQLKAAGSQSRPAPPANLNADPVNPFYGQNVVFTGGLSCMTRSLAWECVAQAGATVGKGVTKETSLLVLGDGFTGDTLNDLLGTHKAQQALRYRTNGQPIEFWSEVDFVEALITADVAPFNRAGPPQTRSATQSKVGVKGSLRTLFKSPPPSAWEPPETYPAIAEPYWRWFEASLSGGDRAAGGEACRICTDSISPSAAWKHRDRHVCSPACNDKLKRRFKAAIKRGEIPDYSPPPPDPYDVAEKLRQPTVFRTVKAADYPPEHGRFPIVGDRLERYGVYTDYLPLSTALNWWWPDELRMAAAAFSTLDILVVSEPVSGAWTLFFTRDGRPAAAGAGHVCLDYQTYPIRYHASPTLPNGLYFNRESISDVDDRGYEFCWEACSFSTIPVSGGWTPARERLSEERRRRAATRPRAIEESF